jgi:Cu/Ag efflux pump CusA
MMRRLIATSLKFRRLIVALAVGLIVFGVMQAPKLAVDDLPEFGPTMVEIRTEALGLSSAEVEQLITVPLEQDLLNGVPFVEAIHSESIPGLSSVVMTFEPGTPLLDARQVVAEKVAEAAVALPGVSTPPQMLQPLSSTSRVLSARLSSETMSPIDMSVLARWVITPRLLGIPGVSNVSIWGQRDRQLQVLVDPAELDANGVSLQQIVETTGNSLWVSPLTFLEASSPGTAGFIDTPNQRFGIRHVLPIKTPEDLGQIPIEGSDGQAVTVNGQTLRLGDVAEVTEDHQLLIGDTVFPEGDGLMLVVEKFPGANTVELTEAVEDAFEELEPGLGDIQVDTSLFRPSDHIVEGMDSLLLSLTIGGILLLLAIALFSGGWRSAVTSVAVVAVSVLAALAVLFIRETPVNVMVVAGLVLALAVIVDDAVGDVGTVAARLRKGSAEGTPAWKRILDASLEMRSSIGYATLISVAVAIPAFFLTGQPGEFIPDLVVTYFLAVAISMIAALTLTPALAMLLLANTPERAARTSRRSGRGFSAPSIRQPRAAFAVAGVALVAGLVSLPFLEGSSSVELQQRDVLVQVDAPPGTSLPAMHATTSDLVGELSGLPGVRDVSGHVGRAVNSDQVVNVNSAQVWVHLDPSADRDASISAIGDVVGGYPDLSHEVLTYPEQQLTDVLEGTDEDLVVRLYGTNVEALRSKAAEVRDAIAGIEGVERPIVELAPDEPTLEIEVDLERAREYAVKPGDVRRDAAILLSSLTVGNLFEEQKVFDVVVWGKPEIREDLDDVRNLMIETPSGVNVTLEDVADVRVVPQPTVLRHEAVSNYVDVSASIAGRDADAVVADVERSVAGIEFPAEHHAEIRGSYAVEGDSRSRLLTVVAAALIAVFLLLQAAFVSWRLAALVFATLPLALAGGALGILALGGVVTIGAGAGFLVVLAIAIRQATVLVRDYQARQDERSAWSGDVAWTATAARGRTILGSAVAIAVALVPLVVRGNVAGLEIVRPMAAVMIGGIVTSTLVALVVLPALYARFGRIARRDNVIDDLTVVVPEAEATVPEPVAGA